MFILRKMGQDLNISLTRFGAKGLATIEPTIKKERRVRILVVVE
jgi:hypothetical protein